jgi:hypothetical protein
MMRVVADAMNASDQITRHIDDLADWRSQVFAQLRKLIREAAPDAIEEWKWNTPVWSQKGNLVAVGAFKDHVKISFFKGASLSDPQGLFNAGLDAKATRAIDIHEGDRLNATALKDLIRVAVAMNGGSVKPAKSRKR